MIYVLSGGGSGATLVITGVAGDTCTITNGSKTKSKTFDSSGKATFKGLATGTWTVKMTNTSGSTATRTVTINADYTLTISYFSATIAVTYPATSKCVITNSSGTTVASDTNTGSSAKTWTATVGASGTYTVTATSTSDSSKTSSTTVSITADGQSETVTLEYRKYLFSETDGNLANWSGQITIYDGYMRTVDGENQQAYCDLVDLTNYKTLRIDYKRVTGGGGNRSWVAPSTGTSITEGTGVQLTSDERAIASLDITAYNGNYRIVIYTWYMMWEIYNIWLE